MNLTISKKSWHYKLYDLSYSIWSLYPKDYGNLCQYVRRLLFLPLALVVVSIIIGFVSIFIIPFGHYPYNFSLSESFDITYRRYDENSKVKAWYITVPLIIIGMFYLFYRVGALGSILTGMGFIVGLIVLVVLFLFVKEETIVGEWVKAKKQGICPLIDFKDE